ncbi:MAG: helix-turn-helix transcriptional regulator [Lachnospiraceae bacterium]|nr:helix-turn-helix transcriptional regulator [Lachnospiraceae bacterium]HCJ09266.1 hypothetical protein [Lachnospiraceae bacterium]
MDKEKFGHFVSALRKEKGMTQKDFAEKLFLTDKAVSKWERGLSFPDISLLEPIAEILDVTVLELLQGERILEEEAVMPVEEVQKMMDESLSISDEEINRKHARSKSIILLCCVIILFCISVALNIRNLANNGRTQVLQTDHAAYETRMDDNGKTVFTDPDRALQQMIMDCKQGKWKEMENYLVILEDSQKEGEKK